MFEIKYFQVSIIPFSIITHYTNANDVYIAFYRRSTFHHARKARDLFTKVRGDNIHSNMFKAHSERVLSSLDLCIALLDDVPTFEAALNHLRVQHIDRNVESYYWTVSIYYRSSRKLGFY